MHACTYARPQLAIEFHMVLMTVVKPCAFAFTTTTVAFVV